jgi:hypothetical protein
VGRAVAARAAGERKAAAHTSWGALVMPKPPSRSGDEAGGIHSLPMIRPKRRWGKARSRIWVVFMMALLIRVLMDIEPVLR